MHNNIVVITSGLIVMVLSACIPVSHYTALETKLEDSRIQRARAEKQLENQAIELMQAQERLRWIEVELRHSETAGNKSYKELKDLKTQYTYLKNINLQLSKNIKTLEQQLNKKKSVIQLQEKVIRLLDDTKKTIETSLKDQIADQEIEVVEVGDKLKVIFVDKILFDSGSVEINPGGEKNIADYGEVSERQQKSGYRS